MTSFMNIAFEEARKAFEVGEIPVGAVIVFKNKIIAKTHNHVLRYKDPTAHAEILAIREAAQFLRNERLQDCDIYITLEPCPMCLAALSQARIRRIYYGADDKKSGGICAGHDLLHAPALHHKPEIYDGILEQECSALLEDFFRKLRN